VNKQSACFPLSRFEAGGLERVQMRIAMGLIRSGIHAELVTRQVDAPAHSLLSSEVMVRALGGGRCVFIYRLARWLQKTKPSVIVTSANDIGCVVLLLRFLFLRDSKVIWTQHLSISGPLHISKGMKWLRLLIEIWLMRRLVKSADAVVAVSQSVADDMRYLIDTNLLVRVVYNPVIAEDFELLSGEKIDWPWLDHVVPTVIFVGRLARVKRIDLLLHAFALCTQSMQARLLVIGDGPEVDMAKELVTNLHLEGVCSLVGHCDNPLPWICHANVLVLCSDFEGFGLVLVEAMACGTQVVSTDCPHGPAELLSKGRYGRLVPVGDVDALAAAISASLKHPYTAVDDLKARAAEFSVESAVAHYLAILNGLVRA
jgi:glycosyltransferase involved in cell wall biosynthesis